MLECGRDAVRAVEEAARRVGGRVVMAGASCGEDGGVEAVSAVVEVPVWDELHCGDLDHIEDECYNIAFELCGDYLPCAEREAKRCIEDAKARFRRLWKPPVVFTAVCEGLQAAVVVDVTEETTEDGTYALCARPVLRVTLRLPGGKTEEAGKVLERLLEAYRIVAGLCGLG